ncbi:signal peptidase I [Anaerobacillus isosaccharinicus]|uniref:Signal peptidase I n=1 Tax=Anaerobacillus isosaccharinicus TaxID=1532552 RepID=A0A1S2L596_9BACI|nr:signal peptidase I [Anaerobacillus isosaccharinicus]MBA5584995.1 signal peptidase I [Anaerobacillus isosaccharinicus]QOY36651.1 signal peptidase I [Anaerobacillus isosaccharinicus]
MELNSQIDHAERKKKIKKEVLSWAKTLVVVLLLVVAIRAFLFTNYIVYGSSMMPTIQDRERVIINKIGYDVGSPDRFDMIVFHANETTDYIKRIIGLPGDTIEFIEDSLYVNGEFIEETYLNGAVAKNNRRHYTEDFKLEWLTGEKTVPDGHYFVLGDNRPNSIDSRHIGFIPFDKIVGKADIAYWPIKDFRKLK